MLATALAAVIAPGICLVGLSVCYAILRTAARQTTPVRFYWVVIAGTVSGLALWLAAELLSTARFGPATGEAQLVIAFASAVLSVVSSIGMLHALQTRERLMSRAAVWLLPPVMVPGATALDMIAHARLAVAPVFAGFLFACLAAFALTLAAWVASRRDTRILGPLRFKAAVTTGMVSVTHMVLSATLAPRTDAVPALVSDILGPALAVSAVTLVTAVALRLDRSKSAESVEELRNLALHDSLTGLPNRLSMHMFLDRTVQEWKEGDGPVCIAVLDLDNFKDVNDVHGHAAGDALLKGLAQQIQKDLGSDEYVYRTGGDEFVAVKMSVGNREGAERFAGRLIGSVNGFDAWMTGDVRIGASVGACLFPEDGKSTNELLSRADLAMYRAKALGRGRHCMFEVAMDEARRAKKALSMDLHRAIRNDELEIHWQPQVDSRNGSLLGFEALLRWDHPDRGTVPPSEFIPLAEQTGQILDVGEWVLLNACREAAAWKRPYRVSVNVAAGQVNQCDLPSLVRTVLARTGLAATRLELEITETGIIRDVKRAYETVWQIKEMGVGLAMDDFGTGYSSLSTLQTFPFDKIKIDRAFIADFGKSKSADAIVSATAQIAHAMGMKVLAEGVEEFEQIAALNRIGCHEMQGFYFSRPLTAEDARRYYGLMEGPLEQFEADRLADAIAHRREVGAA